MSSLGPSLRRKRRRPRAWPRLATALALSLLANAGLLALVRFGVVHAPPPQRAVEMAPLSASEWAANRAVREGSAPASRPPPAAARPAIPPAPAPPVNAPGQVVAVAPSKDTTPPKDSRFVSEENSTVAKETISRHRKAGEKSVQPAPTEAARGEKAAAAGPTGDGGEGEQARRGARGSGEAAPPRREAERERLALRLDRFGDHLPRAERRPEPDPAAPAGDPAAPDAGGAAPVGGARPGRPGAPDLRPSASTYEKLAGGPAPDHVTGVEEGEGTFLNTREWKYSSYFNRIKQAVANTWDPSRALSLRDPDGRRFAYRDRHTVLSVRLDEQGSLLDVEVLSSSGVDFLDDVAKEAFQKAQPFVNPPRGLADPRGQIVFNFGFYLETGGGFRMFRAPSR